MTTDGANWSCKRDGWITMRLSDIVWEQDGVRYLRPEIQLLHKAPARRAVDHG